MAEINWGLLQTPDFFGDAMKYQRAGQVRHGQEEGGAALGAGDYLGAARAYGAAGLGDDARAAMADQNTIDQQHREHDRQGQQDRAKALVQVSKGLLNVPMGQRMQALQGAMPMLQKAGIDPSIFANLTEDRMTDQDLSLFAGEVESHLQGVNLGGGGYGTFNTRSGEFKTVREPTMRPVIVGNGATALDPETQQPIYANPKTYAPPRAHSGGGSGAAAPPWKRNWSPN